MTVRFYMDEHVHGGITEGLRSRGIDVLTVQDDGRVGRSDEMLLHRAGELGRMVFTQDRDFCDLATHYQFEGKTFTGIIYVEKHKLTVAQCIDDLQMIAYCTEPSEWQSQLTRLPL